MVTVTEAQPSGTARHIHRFDPGLLLWLALIAVLVFLVLNPLLRLVLEIATGAIAYIATLLLLHRERMMTFLRTARNLRHASHTK